MLFACLLQALQFLPAPAPPAVATDTQYLAFVTPLIEAESLSQEQIQALRPQTHRQEVSLAFLALGSSAQARLAAVLGAGTESDYLARVLIRAACQAPETNTAVACLLAPAVVPPGTTAALAYLAQDPSRNLSVRAAAMARLLDADEHAVWPLAKALFEGGTRAALDPPAYADWPQGPRWELPKRVLLLSLNDWLERQEIIPSPIEPNAAWQTQLEQIAVAEELWRQAAVGCNPRSRNRYAQQLIVDAQHQQLFDAALAGDPIAKRALPWLRASMNPWLEEVASQDDPSRRDLARHILTFP